MEYKIGDVVLVESTGIFGWVIRFGNWYSNFFKRNKATKYSHAGIMANDYIIIEALPKGVTLHKIPYKKNFNVYRNIELSNEDREKLRSKALKQVGEEYSWYLIVILAIVKFLRLEWLFNGTRHKGDICSVVVAKCYKEIDYSFKENQNVDFIDPMDIAENVIYKNKTWKCIK